MLRSLEFEYFLCFGPKVTLSFGPEFNVMITGKWKDQKHRSNWSGKSSLLEVIKFLLYGESRSKYVKDIPNDNFDKPAKVSGVINIDGKELEISREVQGGTSKLEVKGWSSVDKKVLQARLNRLLGYDYDDFISTCFFNQGEIHQFMAAKPAEKLALLEKWMEILTWDECEQETKERKKEVESKLEEIQEAIEQLPELKSNLRETNESIEETENKIKEEEEQAKRLQDKVDNMRFRIASKGYEDELKQKKDAENESFKLGELKHAEQDLKQIEKDIMSNGEVIREATSNAPELKKLYNRKRDIWSNVERYAARLTECQRDISTVEDRIDKIGSGKQCPLDGKSCVRTDSILDYKKKQRQELKKLQEKEKTISTKKRSLESEHTKVEFSISDMRATANQAEKAELKIETLEEKLTAASKKIERIKHLNAVIKSLNTKLAKSSKSDSLVDKLKKELEEKREELQELQSETKDKYERLGELKNEREQIRTKLKEVKSGEKRMSLLLQQKEVLTFCSLMFGKRGIRSSQLRSRIENIERETNLILDELDSKLQIEIHTERELGAWESSCIYCGRDFPKGYSKRKCDACNNFRRKKRKEEFDIKIVNNGRTRGFNQESGGVKTLVSLAIRLSLVKLRQRITGKSIDLLFLDEIYGMLDSVNREQVYRFLLDYAKNKLGFKQIFQITHIDDGRTEGDKIEVIKRRRFSEVNWA